MLNSTETSDLVERLLAQYDLPSWNRDATILIEAADQLNQLNQLNIKQEEE